MADLNGIPENRRVKGRLSLVRKNFGRPAGNGSAEPADSNKLLCEKAALLELAHDAIIVRDLEARIKYWNKAAEKLYGWTREEAVGKVVYELLKTRSLTPPGEIEAIVMDGGEWQGELIHRTRHNAAVVVESRWALQRDENGYPVAMLEINRDITARKVAESAAKDYAAKLENINRELRDFAFIASHDLQEPLRKLSTYSGMLEARFAGALGKEGLAYVDKMQNAVARMQDLIESLLMYSRVTTRSEPFVWIELGELVRDVLRDLEIPIQETGATVELGDLPSVQADPGQIRQLFQNLMETLSSSTAAVRISRFTETPAGRVRAKYRSKTTASVSMKSILTGFSSPFSACTAKAAPIRAREWGWPYAGR